MARPLAERAQLSEFREVIKTKYGRGGIAIPGTSRDFTFVDFAPLVFRRIRALFAIDEADYVVALTKEYNMSEIMSPGKSKSFFYFSRNLKYMLKTLYPYEAEFLRKILAHYYNHLCENRSTLLTRFLGFYAVKPHKGALRHFVVMNNVFHDNLDIQVKYDLKGSTFGRTAFPRKQPPKGSDLSGVIQKDLDFNIRIELGPARRKAFVAQVLSDSSFLDQMNIMDYSLLLGEWRYGAVLVP